LSHVLLPFFNNLKHRKIHFAVFIILGIIQTGPACFAREQTSVQVNEMQTSGENATNDAIFDARGGYVHPYISLRGEWTDNLYNINVDEISNFLTILAPGIWFGLPRSKKISSGISHYNEAIGGSRYAAPGSGSFDHFQLYLLGGLDYKTYSSNSDLDYTGWHVEGMVQYNIPAGLSFRILDRYTRDRDRFDLGSFIVEDFTIIDENNISVSSTPSRIRDYSSNQANIAVNLDIGEKFTALFDYTNFYLDYDDENNSWLDRTDNRYTLSLAYNHSLKTSLFVQYSQADVSYDSESANDSTNYFFYGGINWKGSAKTSLMAKGGYQVKTFDAAVSGNDGTFDSTGNNDHSTLTMEALYNYLITDKTRINFSLYKALEETDSQFNRGRDSTAARFRYDQKFTSRIQAYCELWYEYSDYEDFNRIENDLLAANPREDTRYMAKPGIQYLFYDWLMAELSYSFENRDSTDDIYDFTTQTVFLSLNAAL
jgi:hypothetical protein